MSERNFLVAIPHLVFAAADVRHAEVHVGKGRLGILGSTERDVRGTFAYDDLARIRNQLLARRVVVVQLDLADGEAIQVIQEHQDDLRRIGASPSRDYDG